MSFLARRGPRRIEFTKNPYGYSIKVRDQNPETRFLPATPEQVDEAIRQMKVIDSMPPARD